MPTIIDNIHNDLEIAKQLYPQILAILKEFERFYDNEDNLAQEKFDFEYQNISKKLEMLTGKDMQDYMLWEWWEDEGIEVLAFRIAMQLPKIYPSFSKKELQEVVSFLVHSNFPTNDKFSENFGY